MKTRITIMTLIIIAMAVAAMALTGSSLRAELCRSTYAIKLSRRERASKDSGLLEKRCQP